MMLALGGYYWIRAIADGPWVIQRWNVSSDGDCGWVGKPYDWNPVEVGELIPDNETLKSLRGWRGDFEINERDNVYE